MSAGKEADTAFASNPQAHLKSGVVLLCSDGLRVPSPDAPVVQIVTENVTAGEQRTPELVVATLCVFELFQFVVAGLFCYANQLKLGWHGNHRGFQMNIND